ncbi:MAG TPA: HAD-IIIA family hydrolase [Candidatus Competibacteraceae bacterium]|nr:HAD-IIIA family hydrolase [Candidatus Contendobacter sp.]HRD49124.1 HAD-IIIA family hydrolase [Candidatus Contendobacter sp.]HRF45051.1 HAD-IIIA family hydrolase [Candidatus Competibacteraceae bacterium]
MNSAKAVFLDRDGVLTVPDFREGRSFAPRRLEEFVIYMDAADAILALKDAGFIIVVVTNQPDVGAGLVHQSVVEAMHDRLRREVAIDDIEVCFETRNQATERRKPGTGMMKDAARKWNLDLAKSYLIGDRESDVQAGLSAGCTTIFIDRGYMKESRPTAQAATALSLGEAVRWILQREQLIAAI